MTALEIINEVQIRLRLPKSTTITDAHAQLLLSFLNEVQRDYMHESVVWDELKTYGNFNTAAGTSLYTISITNSQEGEIIRALKIGTDVPLLDADTLILGATMLAKKEMGLDAQGDAAGFQAKLGLQSDTQGESNFGDVEAV